VAIPIEIELEGNSTLLHSPAIRRCSNLIAIVALFTIASGAAPVDFDRDIRPILSNTCYTCHGPDSNKRATEVRFDQKAGLFAELENASIVVPGQPAMSELYLRVTSDDPDVHMPPADQKQQLSVAQIDLLKLWIEQGAEYSNHWAFDSPQRSALPEVKQKDWPQNATDWFILSRLEREGFKPSQRAAKETLIRRVSLDLTGLPPTIDEVDAYLADKSANAFEKVVDRLLASDRLGEHFALEWLDAARYADSNGYQQDRTRTLWPWRDWVIRAFNSNMPFDQFTVEQIGGDRLPKPTTEQLVATGFQRNHMLNGEGGRIAEESRVEYVVNRVETMGATWLGLTLGCGRCHDHKYDQLSQREFYQFFSYFNSIDESGRVDAGGNANPVLAVPTVEQLDRKAQLTEQVAALEQQIKSTLTVEKQRAWEQKTLNDIENDRLRVYWHRITPASAKSEQGQTMTIEDDGVIFVTGKNPAKDNYDVTLNTDLKNITGIRLEALPHASFTSGGLARSDSGNFVLTELVIEVIPVNSDKPQGAKIASAQASFEQAGWKIAGTFDGNGSTGWAVHNPTNMKLARQAAFVFDAPIGGGQATRINVKLEHQSPHANHNLGRFRLSLTTEPNPKLDGMTSLPQNLVDALKVGPDKRNDAQKKVVADAFCKTSPEASAVQKRVDAARKQLSDVEKQYVRTMIMKDRVQPRETFVLKRGVWDDPDREQPIMPGTPAWLPSLPKDAPTDRLALARWLVSDENPLTARVIVNRYWQRFFGTGLVKTTEDFGTQGDRPSHPQLLDWLATEFVEQNWNVKHILKLIVMSATYQQSSSVLKSGERGRYAGTPRSALRTPNSIDPYNRLLWRGPRFRLTSHAIRDQALYLSGLLVERIGGPPVKPYQPLGIWSDNSLGKIKYQRDSGEKLYRRTLYTFWRRATAPTMLFDVATRQACEVGQRRTNTPLHALVLMNDITFVESSRKFAERVIKLGGAKPQDRLDLAFRMATSRNPNEREQAALLEVLNKMQPEYQAAPEAALKLLSVGESPRDESLDPAELAAYSAVMNLLLNLDEAITKE
jgi:hypothetical protein